MNKKYLFLIIIVFLLFHFFFFTARHHEIHWDEAVYIGMGKYVYSLGSQGLFESIRPLGLPLLLGFLWKLGLGVYSYKTLILLFGCGTLFLTYKIAELTISKDSACYAALLLAITPFFVHGSFSILTEMPATFFILLTLFLLIKKKHPLLVGVTASVVFLFKFPAGIILFAVVLIILMQTKLKKILSKRSPLLYVIIGFILVQIPFFIINYIFYRKYTSGWFDAIFRPLLLAGKHANNMVHSIDGSLQNILYYNVETVMNNSLLIFAYLGLIFIMINKQTRKKMHYYLIPAILLVGYFTFIVNKQLRFAILFVPFCAILAGYGINLTINKIHDWTKTRKFILVAILLIVASYSLYPNFVDVYRFYPTEELDIEREYYYYFDNNPSTILTTEPYFTAYSDNVLAIPFYDNPDEAVKIYDEYKDDVDYIVFNSDFYPCSDDDCMEKIDYLGQDIKANNELVYEKEWYGNDRIIFSTK